MNATSPKPTSAWLGSDDPIAISVKTDSTPTLDLTGAHILEYAQDCSILPSEASLHDIVYARERSTYEDPTDQGLNGGFIIAQGLNQQIPCKH